MPVDLQIPAIRSEKRKTDGRGFIEELQFRRPRLALFERELVLSPFGKKRSEYERAQRHRQYASLRRKQTLGGWQTRVAESANAEGRRPNNRQGDDERGCSGKNRAA